MRFEVLLTEGAQGDLDDIVDYIAENNSTSSADHILNKLAEVVETLASFPQRGSHPRELLELGFREYRQVFFKPYCLIYRAIGKKVYVFVIADGRRDMQRLLARRLLGA